MLILHVQFPPSSVDQSVLSSSSLTTGCPWKGTASYYNITVDGQEAKDAAWYYPQPKTEKAEKLKDHVAFCKSNSCSGPVEKAKGKETDGETDGSKVQVKSE